MADYSSFGMPDWTSDSGGGMPGNQGFEGYGDIFNGPSKNPYINDTSPGAQEPSDSPSAFDVGDFSSGIDPNSFGNDSYFGSDGQLFGGYQDNSGALSSLYSNDTNTDSGDYQKRIGGGLNDMNMVALGDYGDKASNPFLQGNGMSDKSLNVYNNVYNKTGSEGLANGMSKFQGWMEPFQKIAGNPLVSALMSMHPATALLGAAINGPAGLGGYGGAQLGASVGGVPGAIVGGLAGSSLANYELGTGQGPSNGAIGGTIGGLAGYGSGNAMVGSALGRLAGNNFDSSMLGSSNGAPGTGGGTFGNYNPSMGPMNAGGMSPNGGYSVPGSMGLGTNNNNSLLGGLAGMYAYNAANKSTNSQINNLNGLFSQNSPYAQQMQQALDRQDAAAGRRSQYGTRAVELQAALAQQAAKSAPQLQSLYNQQNQYRNMLLSSLINNKGVTSAIGQGVSDLGDLFSNWGNSSAGGEGG